MTESQRSDSGSFLTGFTVGLFAGAAGLFLFGTDKGRKIKDELIAEWESARRSMPDRGDGPAISSLRDIWRTIQRQIDEQVAEGEAKASKSKKRVPHKTSKFKGV